MAKRKSLNMLPKKYLIGGLLLVSVGPAYAIDACVISGSATEPLGLCSAPALVNKSTGYTDSDVKAAQTNLGKASYPIHAFNICRYIDNVSTSSYYIPFATEVEWTSFLGALPVGLSVTACAYPRTVDLSTALSPAVAARYSPSSYDGTIYPVECSNPVAQSSSVPPLEYGRAGTDTAMREASFSCSRQDCNSVGECNTTRWNETIVYTYAATDPKWNLVAVSYGPPPPASNPPPEPPPVVSGDSGSSGGDSGGSGGGACFPPDALVLTKDRGWQPIASLVAGDEVVTYADDGASRLESKPDYLKHTTAIKEIIVTPNQEIMRINGAAISVKHPVLMGDGTYKRAGSLKVGDKVVSVDNQLLAVEKIERPGVMQRVFNLLTEAGKPFVAIGIKVGSWK